MTVLKQELKQNFKSLLIWSMTIGLICYGSILLYKNLEHQLQDMAQLYTNMGEMTKALGLDKVSLATLDGYFATQIVMMFGLGAGMFAAMLGSASLSKEEEGHTSEFLYTLPIRRSSIVLQKYASLLVTLLLFNALIIGLELLGIWQIDLDFSYKSFFQYHALAILMQVEITSLTFLVSAVNTKKQTGLALGLTLILYAMDMMARVIPDIEFLNYLTPYYFANGSDVFSQEKLEPISVIISLGVIILSLLASLAIYRKKDLSA